MARFQAKLTQGLCKQDQALDLQGGTQRTGDKHRTGSRDALEKFP